MAEYRNGKVIQDASLTNTGGAATLGGLIGDVANSSLTARLTALADAGVHTVVKTGLAIDGGSVVDVFTVSGGPVELLGLNMLITTAVSNNACAVYWLNDPTLATAGDTEMCAGADIDSAAIGDVFSIIDADGTQAWVKNATGAAVGRMIEIGSQFILPGGIDFIAANANPTTGAASVYLTYRPLAVGATVVPN